MTLCMRSIQALLARVHMTIDEYLYWDEEVKVFEMAVSSTHYQPLISILYFNCLANNAS